MKEEKRLWLNKIETLDSSALRKFRTGMFLNRLCITYMALFVLAAIVFLAMVLIDLRNGHTGVWQLLLQDLRFLAFAQLSFCIPVFVECFIASRLIDKSFELADELRHLKKFGWNGIPFHS